MQSDRGRGRITSAGAAPRLRRSKTAALLYLTLSIPASILLVACGGAPTPDLEATSRAVIAATEAAQPTETSTCPPTPTFSIATLTQTPTQIPAPTNTPEPTDTPTPSWTPSPVPFTSTPSPCAGATSAGARQRFSFEEIVPCLNTPRKVSLFMRNNVRWEGNYDNRVCGGNQYDPAWVVYQHGVDDCDGHAILQCYFLEANGWDAYMIGLSIEGGGPGHNVCGVNTDSGILVLDNEGEFVGPFSSLADVAWHYIAKGWMWDGGSLRTIKASQITRTTTDYTTPKVIDLPWSFHEY